MDKKQITVTMPLTEFEKLNEAKEKPTSVAALLAEVTKLAFEVTQTKKATVFFEYSAHVNSFQIRIWRGDWASGVLPFFESTEYTNETEKYEKNNSLNFLETCKREILKAAASDEKETPAPQAVEEILF